MTDATDAAGSQPTIVCTRWRPLERNTLRGFADLHLTRARLTIRDCALHEKSDGTAWLALPSKPKIRDGAIVTKDGRAEYDPPLVVIDDAMKEKFQAVAIAAVRAKMAETAAA